MDTYKKLLALKQQREQASQRAAAAEPPSPATKELVAEVRKALGPPSIASHEVERGRKLGDGSFGTVWEGRCRGQQVAIKMLHKQTFDARALATFTQEVDVLSQVFHPRVALFMGACFEPGSYMIITEFVPGGDMERLLRDKTQELTLFQRLGMAIDAALGLTWLHDGEPAFVHRDVKPANFLVERAGDTYRVKVCDFGLSQAVTKGEALRDSKGGARGTPLWMAPEVLMGEQFTTSSDVYSFGIVLWEIVTRKEPYQQFRNYKQFKEAICQNSVRPRVPGHAPPALVALMESCWQRGSEQRPAMRQVLERLEDVLVDVAVEDERGARFWKQSFPRQSAVPFVDFQEKLLEFLSVVAPGEFCRLPEEPSDVEIRGATKDQLQELSERSPSSYQRVYEEFARRQSAMDTSGDEVDIEEAEYGAREACRLHQLSLSCLRAILAIGSGSLEPVDQVELRHWGKALSFFPLRPEGFLSSIPALLAKTWFHGDVNTREAERLLADRPSGTFLVRFSSKIPGAYTISKVSSGRISHQRIARDAKGYTINGTSFQSLEGLLESMAPALGLITSCPGSKYRSLFSSDSATVSGYIANFQG